MRSSVNGLADRIPPPFAPTGAFPPVMVRFLTVMRPEPPWKNTRWGGLADRVTVALDRDRISDGVLSSDVTTPGAVGQGDVRLDIDLGVRLEGRSELGLG